MIDCPCGFGKDIPETQNTCPVCKADLTPLHRIKGMPGQYYDEGVRLVQEGQLDLAIEVLSTAICLNGGLSATHLALGDVYQRKGLFEEALRQYTRGLKLDPENEALRRAKENAEAARLASEPGRTEDSRRITGLKRLLVVTPLLGFLFGLSVLPLLHSLRRGNQSVSPSINYSALATDLRGRLAVEPVLNGLRIEVTQTGNKLRVSGDVPTQVYKTLILEMVKTAIANGAQVITDINVVSSRETEHNAYTVRERDTLSSLAVKYYGDSRMWTRIYAANRKTLHAPNALSVGQVLVIPK